MTSPLTIDSKSSGLTIVILILLLLNVCKSQAQIFYLNTNDADSKRLMNAIKKKDFEKAIALVEVVKDVNCTFQNGVTFLIQSSVDGNMELCRKLIEKGANPDMQNSMGYTAMMIAAISNKPELINLLLTNGAKLDIKNKFGQTALIIASLNGNIEVSELLVKKGANIDIQDKKGKTALMIAKSKNNNDIVNILLNHGTESEIRNKNKDLIASNVAGQKASSENTNHLEAKEEDKLASTISRVPDSAFLINRSMKKVVVILQEKNHKLINKEILMNYYDEDLLSYNIIKGTTNSGGEVAFSIPGLTNGASFSYSLAFTNENLKGGMAFRIPPANLYGGQDSITLNLVKDKEWHIENSGAPIQWVNFADKRSRTGDSKTDINILKYNWNTQEASNSVQLAIVNGRIKNIGVGDIFLQGSIINVSIK